MNHAAISATKNAKAAVSKETTTMTPTMCVVEATATTALRRTLKKLTRKATKTISRIVCGNQERKAEDRSECNEEYGSCNLDDKFENCKSQFKIYQSLEKV